MTAHNDLKKLIRVRKSKTGESYTAARAHVMRERAALLGLCADGAAPQGPERVEAIVLAVNKRSARMRIVGEGEVTCRSSAVCEVVPGHLVTLVIKKRWTWPGGAYVSAAIENVRMDVAKLGLAPLPLQGGQLEDLRRDSEPYRRPDPYAPLWRKLTSRPRPSFQMDRIAWGAFPGAGVDDNLTCDASELAEVGEVEGARALLMKVLRRDLRCIDAHALLGNLEFSHRPQRAIVHFEMGMRIGELSFPPAFDGLFVWGPIYNRPFLRCLHGYGLCLWRLGRNDEARRVFERILALNPNDNQGVRGCWHDVCCGRSWDDLQAADRWSRNQDPRLH